MAVNKKPPSVRTLDKDAPELKEYLKPGAKVLDVCCGSGIIARDVAEATFPDEPFDVIYSYKELANKYARGIQY